MYMIQNLFCIIVTLKFSTSSIVMDSLSQKNIMISDYCPKMEHCPEGAHVMCMYYNPDMIMGPRCHSPQNISMTSELAEKLLDVSNGIRSKIALGKETGKDGTELPRGYGMFKLKWDKELATFAQVLANQCVLRHDLCRATKKFADPGQTAGLVRFSDPDWYPVSGGGNFNTPGLNTEKITYAITQTLKSWYGQKASVTPEMIISYPDWSMEPYNRGLGRLYLDIIHGPATHMGCGVSAYTEYAYYTRAPALHYNSIQVICNYSARPRKGTSVYNTEPPHDDTVSARCGCPEGSKEDTDCLCTESIKAVPENVDCPDLARCHLNAANIQPLKMATAPCIGDDCHPSVVLLPIFTMEDAPPHKLLEGFNSTKGETMDIFDYYDAKHSAAVVPQKPPKEIARYYVKPTKNIKKRYFNKSPFGHKHTIINRKPTKYKKPSIFSRVKKFELPRKSFNSYKGTMNELKKDVAPRKDFSKIQNLVKNYYNKRRNRGKVISKLDSSKTNAINHKKSIFARPATTETVLNRAEENVIKYNGVRNIMDSNEKHNIFNDTTKHKKNYNEENDNKLMNLLNNLEQEVKHIELDGNEKQIFDAKIRKIYGTVVGKPVNLLDTRKKNIETEVIQKLEGYKTEHEIIKPNQINEHTDFDIEKIIGKHEINEKEYKDFKAEPRNRNYSILEKYDPDNNAIRNTDNFNENYKNKGIKPYPYDLDEKDILSEIHDYDVKGTLHEPKTIYDKYSDIDFDKPVERKQNLEYDDKNFNHRNLRQQNDYDRYAKYEETNRMRNVNRNIDEYNPKARKPIESSRNQWPSNNINDDLGTHYSNKNNKHDDYDDLLSVDRRKYYQNKIDNMERRIKNSRSYKRRNELENDRHMRPMRPTNQEQMQMRPRKSKSQGDSIYMPDRARFLHGF